MAVKQNQEDREDEIVSRSMSACNNMLSLFTTCFALTLWFENEIMSR